MSITRLAPFLVLAAALAGEPSPAAVDLRRGAWEVPAAHAIETGARSRVLLNGFWLRRAADGAEVQARIPDWEGGGAGSLLWREVEIPAHWAGRRLRLRGPGERYLGEAVKPPAVAFAGRPAAWDAEQGYDLGPAVPGWQRLEVAAGTITADCWLTALPSELAIGDAYLRTRFRGGPIASLRAAGRAAPHARLRLECAISERPQGPAIRTCAAEVTAGGDGSWSAEPALAWDLRLWSRWQPSLYWFTAILIDGDGRLLDATLPQRFGFKEAWVEDGRVVLNGVPTSVIGDSCTKWSLWVFQHQGNVHPEQARAQMRLFKSLGLTGIEANSEALYELADEEGMLTGAYVGSLVRNVNVWDPSSGLTPMTGRESEDDIRRRVRAARQHPSVVGYATSTVYSLGMMHPELIGRPYPTWEHFPLNRNAVRSREAYRTALRVRDLVAPLDPDRWLNLPDGPEGVYDGATRYLCDNLDLQECEDFFAFWHRSERRKAVGLAEYGIPFDGHLFLRRIDHQMPHTGAWPTIHVENAARWYGPSVYGVEDEARVRGWPGQGYGGALASPVTRRMQADSATAYLHAWRTCGIDLFGHHVLDAGAIGSRQPLPAGPADADPRHPGYSRPAPLWSLGHADLAPWTEMGRAYLAAATPLLAYIGGADGAFTAKDHLFIAGQEVRKAVLVVNDYDAPVPVSASWRLDDAQGRQVAGGTLAATVAAGDRELRALTIAFPAPAVTERSDFTLSVACTAERPGTLADRFRITVFPPASPARPGFRGAVWKLNLSDDYSHETPHFFHNRDNEALLKAAGVEARLVGGLREFSWLGYSPDAAAAAHDPRKRPAAAAGQPGPGDLLIIPRQTLGAGVDDRQTCLRLLQAMDLDRRVEEGLDVLVLEQDLANVFGVQTEDTRPRRVFPAAPGHPALAGLTDEDFSYWSGDSDLQDAISPYTSSQRRFPDRVYHSSNRNAVASRTFIRPQVGACRALLVSGFDLQESPLLEITRGRGRIILCSLDVTNRYGRDPVATRLVDNLLRYLATAPRPDPARGALAAPAAGATAAATMRLPVPEGELGWGITPGDLFQREAVFAAAGTATAAMVLEDGAVARLRDGGVVTAIDPARHATGWQRRKAAWVRAALRVNAGGSQAEGPALRWHGQALPLYPHAWVEGFCHPYTSDIW